MSYTGKLGATSNLLKSNYLLNREEFIRSTRPLNAKDYGAIGDGVVDDTRALTLFLDDCRNKRQKGYVPSGTYKITSTLNISGCDIEGTYVSYYNVESAKIIGNGTFPIFEQTDQTSQLFKFSLKNFLLMGGTVGLQLKYGVNGLFENIVCDTCTVGIKISDSGVIEGSLWHRFYSCKTNNCTYGLQIQGINFCNANVFDTCYFKATTTCVSIDVPNGYNGVANYFFNTEIVGNGIGVEIKKSKNTVFENCYIEVKSPSFKITGPSNGTAINNCVFGSLKNTSPNTTGVNAFIWHVSGTVKLSVYGGTIFLGNGADQANLRFIHSDDSANLHTTMLKFPDKNIIATGFEFFDTGLPTNNFLMNYSAEYTPAWTSATGSVSVGNATLSGKYTLSGKLCSATILLYWDPGSTINFGMASDFRFTLPFDINASALDEVSSALLQDGTTGNYYTGAVSSVGTNQVIVLFNNNGAALKYDNPTIWSSLNGGFFKITYVYEIDNTI